MRTRVFSPTYPTWALVGGTSRPVGETVSVLVLTHEKSLTSTCKMSGTFSEMTHRLQKNSRKIKHFIVNGQQDKKEKTSLYILNKL